MSRKRCFVNKKSGKKFEEIFDAFVVAKTAKGVSATAATDVKVDTLDASNGRALFIGLKAF